MFPFRLCPISAVIVSLFAGFGAVAAHAESDGMTVAAVEFNDVFLHQPSGPRIDVGRFNRGIVVLPGKYRAALRVNDMPLGNADITLRQIGDDPRNVQPCFDRALVERIGVDVTRLAPEAGARLAAATSEACLLLPDLVPGATAKFDGSEQELDVTVPQIFMNRSPRGYVDPQYWDDGVVAGRLQYNANAYRSEGAGVSTTQAYVGLNAGLNFGPWRLSHSGSYSHSDAMGNHYQSIETNARRSIASIKSQLTLGDAFTDGVIFDSFGFRGARMATDDRMFPESQRGYAPTIHGSANSNARVQIRQNGNIIYETTVSPGPFEINDLFPTGYGGDLDVIVTEADGSVHTSRVPYAPVVNALRPGVSRYGVTVGQYRNPTVHLTPLFAQATYQRGLSNMFTGYGGILVAENYFSAVAGLALNTEYGAFGADVTHASTRLTNLPDREGQSLRLSYSKLVAPTRTNLTLAAYRYSTKGFLNFADAVALQDLDNQKAGALANPIQRGRLQATVSQSLPAGYGTFYVSGSTQDYWNRSGRDTQFQAGYNNVYKSVSYGVSAGRQFNVGTARWDNRIMLTLGIPLGKGAHPVNSFTTLQHDSNGVTSVQESVGGTAGDDNAVAYALNAGYAGGGDTSSATTIGGSATYVSPVTTVTANASKSGNYSQVGAGISGGIVAFPGGVTMTPTSGETIAVVEASDAAGARVLNSNGLRVDPWGHAVVTNLQPFSRNLIEIDPKDLPLNVELKSTLEQVAPTAGAVVKVKFDTVSSGLAALLDLQTPDGKGVPFGAELFNEAGASVGTVGQGGRVLARGLAQNAGTLFAKWGEGSSDKCTIQYSLPATAGSKQTALSQVEAVCR